MTMFAGLDVGFKRTAVSVVDGAGKSVWACSEAWRIGLSGSLHGRAAGSGCGEEPTSEVGQSGCLCAGEDAAGRLVQCGAREERGESPAQGAAEGARPARGGQARARQAGARAATTVRHQTFLTGPPPPPPPPDTTPPSVPTGLTATAV